MRIFIVGDYYSHTGPANVTLALIEQQEGKGFYLRSRNKLLRLAELAVKIPFSDVCVISGHSKQNIITQKLAALFKKKTIFLMHGCVEYENEINKEVSASMTAVERETLERADLILAVSEEFEQWLKAHYPQLSEKLSHLTNGCDWVGLEKRLESIKQTDKCENRLISVGGGMPRKRIVRICEAIKLLEKQGVSCTLTVAGAKGADSDVINGYPFVRNLGLIPGQELLKEMKNSCLFIQNSCFETFGLAPVEALSAGCSVLLSRHVGALSVIDKAVIRSEDIIEDCENPAEIAEKIKLLLGSPNAERLNAGIDRAATSWSAVYKRLETIAEKLLEKRD